MADLIDRQAFIEGQCNSCDGWCEDVNCDCLHCKSDCRCDFIKDLADEPAVDAVPIEEYNKLKEQYERWKSVATIFGDALREYQRKYEE